MRKAFLLIGITLVSFSSCSSDSDSPLPDEPVSPPVIGAYTAENQWIYGQMNHYYLWREEMPDSLACDYVTDPVTFYKALLSPKDRFSYCLRNTDYTGPSEIADYGFAYQEYNNGTNDKMLQVLYVTSQKCREQGVRRGDWLKKISSNLVATTFERETLQDGKLQVVDTLMIEASVWEGQSNTVYLDSIYTIGNRKIGYLCYLEFDNISDLEKPFKRFYDNQIDELVLDLRYNPGGYVRTCRYLCNTIVNERGYRQIFQQCSYNNRVSEEYLKATGSRNTTEYYEAPVNDAEEILGNRLYGLNLKRLYVLTSQYTASASEASIICLKPYMDVMVIGEQTYGKGVGSWTISEKQYKYMLQPITMRYYNADMETTPDEGLPVDVEVTGGYDTVKRDLGDTEEPLLAIALQYIAGKEISSTATTRTENFGLIPAGVPSFFKKTISEY